MSFRGLSAALVILSLGACGRESVPLAETPVFERPAPPFPVVDIRASRGDGSIGWVLEEAVAAFRENGYYCADLGTTQPNGNVISNRKYTIGGRTGTHVKIFTLNGVVLSRSATYTDQAGQRRVVNEWENRPLIGADSVARRIFDAAAAAP